MKNNTQSGSVATPGGTARESAAGGWKAALRDAVRDPLALIEALELPPSLLDPARRAARSFPLVVPRSFLDRMRRGDPGDPLLRQVLPLDLEAAHVDGFDRDPLAESHAARAAGLLRKYAGRALLVTTGVCAVHCRYCFRRHFPYDEAPRGLEAWTPALKELAGEPTIREVILSGGDPLVLSDSFLERLVARLEEIPHLRRLRVHTRLPIVLPERVDARLLAWLGTSRLTPVVVVHANHAREIAADCAAALRRLVGSGIPVLNQAVLLRGVNDDVESLADLCEALIDVSVLPYYLHQLDPVEGAAHFMVPVERGRELVAELRRRLPGYLVPRYVAEIPGEASKVDLC